LVNAASFLPSYQSEILNDVPTGAVHAREREQRQTNMKRAQKLLVIMILSFLMPHMVSGGPIAADGQTQPEYNIAASVESLGCIVRSAFGPIANVTVLMTQDVDPHAPSTTPAMIAAADSADLLVLTGHFEWEKTLANETATPFVTLYEGEGMESYQDYGARLSPLPGIAPAEEPGHDPAASGNPHGYWLLPGNAIAIANATMHAMATLNSTHATMLQQSLEDFVHSVDTLRSFIADMDTMSGFSEMRAVAVFPAEAYVAEGFGIEVDAVLQVGEITIDASTLYRVQEAIRNGSIQLIVGSDVAQFQTGGEYAYQLQSDVGGILVWWKTVTFSDHSDYIGLMTYNLGALMSGLQAGTGGVGSQTMSILFIAASGVLAIIVVIETIILFQRARAE
jgi:ABC-type Zn uptake system ZnuABC Zn-binding protein ZnuA